MAQRIKDAAREKALWTSRAKGKQKASSGPARQSSLTALDMDLDPAPEPTSSARVKSSVPLSSTTASQSTDATTTTTLLDSGNRRRGSLATHGDGSRSTPLKLDSSQPQARKMVFQQYRSPVASAHVNYSGRGRRRSSADRRLSMDMEYTSSSNGGQGPPETTSNVSSLPPSSAPIAASRTEDTFAMDMDQLQQSMTRLMIPRQVANKIKRPPQRQ